MRQPRPVLDIDAPAGIEAFADPERLHQVIANLVDNAIRHGPSGEPVHIEAGRDGATVMIAVSDRGPGIDANRLPHIFDRYVGSSTAGSTGLGLAIAKSIVDRHDGTISVANTGSGCRFEVRLPTAPTG
jgi:signal transduction histidine kinase